MWLKTSVKRLWPGDQKRKIPGDVVEVTEQLGRALLQTDRTWTETNPPSFDEPTQAAPAIQPLSGNVHTPDISEAPSVPARRGRPRRVQDDVPVAPESGGDGNTSQDGQDTVAGGASEVVAESGEGESEPAAEPQAEPAADQAAAATETPAAN